MGKTQFSGPVRTGKDNGIPAQKTVGTLMAQQAVSVASDTSGASTIVLPPDTRIDDITVKVHAAVTATLTQGALVRVGTTSDPAFYASIKVSGAGVYRPGVVPNVAAASAANWLAGTTTAPQRLFIDVTAAVAASADDVQTLQGILTVDYFQRS